MKKFYVTTPIYYPNDIPHIGHFYTTLAADILARWHKLKGEDVFFLTGTDEHGKKIETAAQKKGEEPKEFVDGLIPKFIEAWKKLNIDYSRFIRTTEAAHIDTVRFMYDKSYKKGDIYKGFYEGLYCTGCEAYYQEKELETGCCPVHKTKVEILKEESYFFKLSAYRDRLLEHYEKNKSFVRPESRYNEILFRIKEGLLDFSISRNSFKWGIELPFDKEHIAYVWFDALTNYLSGVNYLTNKEQKYWPADLHLVGKDILWFHAVIWPAMLMSAEIPLPGQIFAHGWWTFNKEKISKSRGKVINVDELIAIAGVDAARYFLFAETTFGQDGDFSTEGLLRRRDADLANELGNLVSRALTMCEKYCAGKVPVYKEENCALGAGEIKEAAISAVARCCQCMEEIDFSGALNGIWSFIKLLNQYVEKTAPWKLAKNNEKEKLDTVIHVMLEGIRLTAVLLGPFIPETSEKILGQLGLEAQEKISFENKAKWGQLQAGTPIKKGKILFPKDLTTKNG